MALAHGFTATIYVGTMWSNWNDERISEQNPCYSRDCRMSSNGPDPDTQSEFVLPFPLFPLFPHPLPRDFAHQDTAVVNQE